MAIYRWIYANTENINDNRDYFVGLCDDALTPYTEMLIQISNRLLSVRMRTGDKKTQQCWMAGYLSQENRKKVYVVGLGGEQEEILGRKVRTSGNRNRGLFCVLLYGFTEEDIGIYQRDTSLFEPLKEILIKIHEDTMTESPMTDEEKQKVRCCRQSNYKNRTALLKIREERTSPSLSSYNILKSTPQNDELLWQNSKAHFVAIQLLTIEDAMLLIKKLPEIRTSVIGETKNYQYRFTQKNSEKQVMSRRIQNPVIFETQKVVQTIQKPVNENKERENTKTGEEEIQEKKSETRARKSLKEWKSERIRKNKEKELELEKKKEYTNKMRQWCYKQFSVEQKAWIDGSVGKLKKEKQGDYKEFLSLYLWMQIYGKQELASDIINTTAKQTGGNGGVYYPTISSEEEAMRVLKKWHMGKGNSNTSASEIKYQLAKVIGELSTGTKDK